MVYDVVARVQGSGTNILTTENTEGTEAAAPHKISKFSCGVVASVFSSGSMGLLHLIEWKRVFQRFKIGLGQGFPSHAQSLFDRGCELEF